jgi:hypothetical protein
MANGEAAHILNEKIAEGEVDYDDEADEYEIVDPDLREFVQSHGFGLYA